MVSHLLPLEHEMPRCSDYNRSLGARPFGTGLRIDRAIVVAVPLPWPKPALKHPLIQPLVATLTPSPVPTRLFAGEPLPDEASLFVFEVFERAGLGARHYRWTSSSASMLADLGGMVAKADLGTLGTLGQHVAGAMHADEWLTTPTLLVCTQGSHDQCCGRYGVELADMIERAFPLAHVRRISHTGGHRFAPTLLALPTGRMWAYVDADLVARIVDGTETTADLVDRCRGWWGASIGAEQVAECVARAEFGRAFDSEPAFVASESVDGRIVHTVATENASIPVAVRVAREIPTIACEAPGGRPAKMGREFAANIVAEGLEITVSQ